MRKQNEPKNWVNNKDFTWYIGCMCIVIYYILGVSASPIDNLYEKVIKIEMLMLSFTALMGISIMLMVDYYTSNLELGLISGIVFGVLMVLVFTEEKWWYIMYETAKNLLVIGIAVYILWTLYKVGKGGN